MIIIVLGTMLFIVLLLSCTIQRSHGLNLRCHVLYNHTLQKNDEFILLELDMAWLKTTIINRWFPT